jgi:exoribonuclease R
LKRKVFNGVLTEKKGHLYFTPMDPKYLEMLVIHMTDQAFQEVRDQEYPYGYTDNLGTLISEQYLHRTFFYAKYICWEANSLSAFASITKRYGSVDDIDQYKLAIMEENNIQPDKFPPKVKKEAVSIFNSFGSTLKKERQLRTVRDDLFVFSIDNKNTMAIDDAVSIE